MFFGFLGLLIFAGISCSETSEREKPPSVKTDTVPVERPLKPDYFPPSEPSNSENRDNKPPPIEVKPSTEEAITSPTSPHNIDVLSTGDVSGFQIQMEFSQTQVSQEVSDIIKTWDTEVVQALGNIKIPEEEKKEKISSLRFQLFEFKDNVEREVESLFRDLPDHTERMNGFLTVRNNIESEVREIISNSFLLQHFSENLREKMIQSGALAVENSARKKAIHLISEQAITSHNLLFDTKMNNLQNTLWEHSNAMEYPATVEMLFDRNITSKVRESVRGKYDRSSLGLLSDYDEVVSAFDENAHKFQSVQAVRPGIISIRGSYLLPKDRYLPPDLRDFLYKSIRLYKRLQNLNPYHEQGVLAKNCGLAALQLADQGITQWHERKTNVFYQSALALKDIVLGQLPMGIEKNIYEFCTKKHLLTGESLTEEYILALPVDESYFKDADSALTSRSEVVEMLNRIHIKANDGNNKSSIQNSEKLNDD